MVSRLAQGCLEVVSFSITLYLGYTKYVPGLKTLKCQGSYNIFNKLVFYMGNSVDARPYTDAVHKHM